jgi:hypothetical protein
MNGNGCPRAPSGTLLRARCHPVLGNHTRNSLKSDKFLHEGVTKVQPAQGLPGFRRKVRDRRNDACRKLPEHSNGRVGGIQFGTVRNLKATAISARSHKPILGLFVLAIIVTHAFFLWAVRDRIARGDPDFTVFYTAGKILRQGRGAMLYDPGTQHEVQRQFTSNSEVRRGPLPYIHPPFEALVFLPLTYFSYPVAFGIWSVLNLGLLVGIAATLRSVLPSLKAFSLVELFLKSLAFFPIFATFHQGQDSILLLLVLVLGFRALNGGADFKAGCWLGFGIFKYHLMIPLILVVAIWRGRKVLGGFVTTAASLSLVSLVLVGWQGALRYPILAWRVVTSPAYGGIPYRQMPNLAGLIGGWPGLQDSRFVPFAAVIGAIGILILIASMGRAARYGDFGLCFACAVIAAVLVAFSTNTYDLSWLVLPVALIFDYCARRLQGSATGRWRIVLPAVPLLMSPLWFYLWLRWEQIHLIAIFLVWWLFAIRAEVKRATERTRLEAVAIA